MEIVKLIQILKKINSEINKRKIKKTSNSEKNLFSNFSNQIEKAN